MIIFFRFFEKKSIFAIWGRFWAVNVKATKPEIKPQTPNRGAFLWVWGRVLHFLLFRTFDPLKAYTLWKSHHPYSKWENPHLTCISLILLTIDPKTGSFDVFFFFEFHKAGYTNISVRLCFRIDCAINTVISHNRPQEEFWIDNFLWLTTGGVLDL